MVTSSLKRLRRTAGRALDVSPQLLRNPSHLRAGLSGVHIGVLEALDKPWLREMGIAAVVDVGANTGQFARAAHHVFPDARIYAFEPLPDCLETMRRRMDGVANFEAFGSAIGNEEGTVTIHRSAFSPSSSILDMTSKHMEAFPWTADGTDLEVEIHRLDAFLPRMNLEGKVLLKIDVQGFSQQVLLGAAVTLAQSDMVFIETSFVGLYEGEATFDDIYRFMKEAGYTFIGFLDQLEHPGTGQILQGDAIFSRM
jgi:FkbM family methyltransferase